jgi:hypothetical protein
MKRYFYSKIIYRSSNKNGLNKIDIIRILLNIDISSFHSNVHTFLKYFSNIIIDFCYKLIIFFYSFDFRNSVYFFFLFRVQLSHLLFWMVSPFVTEMLFNVAYRFATTAGLGSKLRFILWFSLNIQIQNHFPIKPNAQIRCSSCYRLYSFFPFNAINYSVFVPIYF